MDLKDKGKKRCFSRREWLSFSFAGVGLIAVRPAPAAAALVSMRVAEHWRPGG